jgi:hypothetical protein
VDDPTNFVPTYALRNAIRHIVRHQTDLPWALRKPNLIVLASHGDQFRMDVLARVNELLSLCSFARETFTGKLKVACPPTVHQTPPRILRHFLPALARIFKSNKVENFAFRGVGSDLFSSEIANNFLNPNVPTFNVQSLSFRKIDKKLSRTLNLVITPEEPRRRTREKMTIPVQFGSEADDGWRYATHEEHLGPWAISISVQKDLGYYLRPLNDKDISSVEKWVPEHSRHLWNNGIHRAIYYPKSLFPVLCHREGDDEREIRDALPRFGIDISSGVRTSCGGPYGEHDLETEKEQWVHLENVE